MKVLYPLQSLKSGDPEPESPVTALVNLSTTTERREPCLLALKTLLDAFETFPGAIGARVFEQQEGQSVRITIVQRFSSAADNAAWLKSDAFAQWEQTAAKLAPNVDSARTYSGIEALFAAGQAPDAPPRWKMAFVLLLAVFPLSLALSHWFGKALASIPPLVGALITSPVMVVLMTYIMVPILTRLFNRWLQPAKQ